MKFLEKCFKIHNLILFDKLRRFVSVLGQKMYNIDQKLDFLGYFRQNLTKLHDYFSLVTL
jgi:hypothetical protein